MASAANRGRHEDQRRVRAGRRHGLRDRVEHRDPFDVLPALAGCDAGHDRRAVRTVPERVEGAFVAGDPLDDAASCRSSIRMAMRPPPRARARPPRPRSIVAAGDDPWMRASARIARPSSALVPSSRTTIGTVASTLPSASRMPAGDHVAACDAAEDVDQDAPDRRVGQDHLAARSPSSQRSRRRRHPGSSPPSRRPASTTSSVDITRPAPLPMMPT